MISRRTLGIAGLAGLLSVAAAGTARGVDWAAAANEMIGKSASEKAAIYGRTFSQAVQEDEADKARKEAKKDAEEIKNMLQENTEYQRQSNVQQDMPYEKPSKIEALFTCAKWVDADNDGQVSTEELKDKKEVWNQGEIMKIVYQVRTTETGKGRFMVYGPKGEILYDTPIVVKNGATYGASNGELGKQVDEWTKGILARGGPGLYRVFVSVDDEERACKFIVKDNREKDSKTADNATVAGNRAIIKR